MDFKREAHSIVELLRVMHRLRSSVGCPWDREQTLHSLRPYLIEEAYEVLDALDTGDVQDHRDELGDLLLQIIFQCEIRSEQSEFRFGDVVDAICSKLIRRHPHVFGDSAGRDRTAVGKTWETIKAGERAAAHKPAGRFSGLPTQLPALLLAYRTGQKAAAVGFDWPDIDGAWRKLEEELDELRAAECDEQIEEELGDVLFSICNVARHLSTDPESALRGTIRKFRRRFEFVENALERQGSRLEETGLDELDRLWELAKEEYAVNTQGCE